MSVFELKAREMKWQFENSLQIGKLWQFSKNVHIFGFKWKFLAHQHIDVATSQYTNTRSPTQPKVWCINKKREIFPQKISPWNFQSFSRSLSLLIQQFSLIQFSRHSVRKPKGWKTQKRPVEIRLCLKWNFFKWIKVF